MPIGISHERGALRRSRIRRDCTDLKGVKDMPSSVSGERLKRSADRGATRTPRSAMLALWSSSDSSGSSPNHALWKPRCSRIRSAPRS